MALRTGYLRFSRSSLLQHPEGSSRLFSSTSRWSLPRKNSQDKDSIDTEATEYSKSGTDDGAARQAEAAFDPKTTSPEKEKKIAGEGKGAGNPLEASPANQEISKPAGSGKGAENSGKE